MNKKIFYFSTGLPDPTQGGSGLINYLVVKELLNQGYKVQGLFRVNEEFIKNHCNSAYVQELEKQGLVWRTVKEKKENRSFSFGYDFLKKTHHYTTCLQTVNELKNKIESSSGCISLDLGWALALAKCKINKVCLLGDPVQSVMKYSQEYSLFSLFSWRQWLIMKSLFSKKVYRFLVHDLQDPKMNLGIFSPHHAKEYQENGVSCNYFHFFSFPVNSINRIYGKKDKIVALHVGSLSTTASRSMFLYWQDEILPALGKLSFEIEIRFVGRGDQQQLVSKEKNVKLIFLGYLESLDQEFIDADLYFSPMKYPVGVRTRIITALAYGIPVVADKTAAWGLPDLEANKNIFYGSNGKEIAETVQTIYENPAKAKEVGDNAKLAWNQCYNPAINIPKIISYLPLDRM
jgi:glycosyltransferase involved in cell wall biosynthesis